MQEMQVQSLGQEDPLEKEMATHSSLLAWEISWTEEPGGLQSIGLQKSQTRLSEQTTRKRVIGVSEGKETEWAEKISEDIIAKEFLYLVKNKPLTMSSLVA